MKNSILNCFPNNFFCFAEFDARQEIIKFMEGNKDLEKYLHAPVTVTQTDTGCLSIKDEGIFAFQHELLPPEGVGRSECGHRQKCYRSIPMPTNWSWSSMAGWTRAKTTGRAKWPRRLAERVDPNEWVCAAYDWKGGSVVITSVQAAEYARDIAGPRLAKAILALGTDFKHIHLIGHSAGSWAIQSAAKQIAAARPDTQFHLTFLDAYVPEKWDPDILGRIFDRCRKTKIAGLGRTVLHQGHHLEVTEHDLKYAHNVDISAIDPLISEHEFPYRWYAATITGQFTRWDEKKEPVYTRSGGIDYGFARVLESGQENWNQSRKLKTNNSAIKIEKESKKGRREPKNNWFGR